ncbi:hypothetical protein HanXRQr2_Chr11g0502251 [Helianthus annuus]|uniref:Uncharacterized protein n=1 Tax=Helianthus annuus TaxID=4232 RepID=A0A9K3HQQ8_HELAN|nr:hypothetical protein HanXRQr2_Chr11g0502251 [Helianthus annuus]
MIIIFIHLCRDKNDHNLQTNVLLMCYCLKSVHMVWVITCFGVYAKKNFFYFINLTAL